MRKTVFIFGLILIITGVMLFWLTTPYKYVLEGTALLESGKVAKAVKIVEEGVKKYPTNSKLNFLLARGYLHLGETEQANKTLLLKDTINTLKSSKELQNFLVDISRANHRVGNVKLSRSFAYKYLENHNEDEISKKIVENYISIGEVLPEKSVLLWEKAYNIAYALRETELKESLKALLLPRYFEIVNGLKAKKDFDEAINILNKAKLIGKNAETNFQEALLYADIGKLDQAQNQFEEAIQLDPENENYKIAYANLLKDEALMTKEQVKKEEYLGKIELLLNDLKDNVRKASVLNKIMNLNAKYKILNANLKMAKIGEYVYPTLVFRIKPVSDIKLKKYKIIFLDKNNTWLDVYESQITDDDIDKLIEVTSKNPASENNVISAKLFLNDELVKEYTTK